MTDAELREMGQINYDAYGQYIESGYSASIDGYEDRMAGAVDEVRFGSNDQYAKGWLEANNHIPQMIKLGWIDGWNHSQENGEDDYE